MRKSFALSPEQREDARKAIRLLGDVPLTLEHCVRHTLGMRIQGVDLPLGDAGDRFLASRKSRVRQTTYTFYEWTITAMLRHWDSSLPIGHITAHEWQGWVDGQSGRLKVARTLLRWCHRQVEGSCSPDILDSIEIDGRRWKEPAFLPVSDARAVMQGMYHLAPAMALLLFAGLRTSELGGGGKPLLTWGHVDCQGRIIRIPGTIAKTGVTRVLEGLPDNIWSWLEPGSRVHPRSHPVCPVQSATVIRKARTLVANYPKNAARHSFATYHVAAFQNPGHTALLLGHQGNMNILYRHYRGLATKSEGEEFFALWS